MEDIGFMYMISPITRPEIKRTVQSLIYNEKRSISCVCVCVCIYALIIFVYSKHLANRMFVGNRRLNVISPDLGVDTLLDKIH